MTKSGSRKTRPARKTAAIAAKQRKVPPATLSRLDAQLRTARQQQAATAEILRAVADAAGDAARPLQFIAETTARLFGAPSVAIQLAEGSEFTREYRVGDIAKRVGSAYPRSRIKVGGRNLPGTVVAESRQIHIPDLDRLDPSMSDFPGLPHARAAGARTVCGTPLRRDGKAIGSLIVLRDELLPFTADELALQQSFADQAVIAIENARLFAEVEAKSRELEESLQRQTATANVLKVISRSVFDLQAVLETLTRSAVELSGALRGTIWLRDGEVMRFRAVSHPDLAPEWVRFMRENPQRPGRHSTIGRAILSARTVCTPDVEADPEIRMPAYLAGIRAVLAVPLLRDGRVEGVMALSRQVPGPFSARQIELVEGFADQAVIAIENVRLFDEVQAKTNDLTDALTYQTGSANILKVIASSPTDVEPVLKAIVETACEVCEAYDAAVVLRDGDDLRFSAHHGPIPIGLAKWPINRLWTAGRAFIDQKPVHITDLTDERHGDLPDGRELAIKMGHRSILSVPLMRENESIGAIVLRRREVRPFSDKQIGLLQTFADQAVIAIGNVQLFEQVQQRTRELSQSLDDLRSAQDRLIQTEKLASLGQLTAGIAHEIKNPLNFVNNFSALSAELVDELDQTLGPARLDQDTRDEIGELTAMLKSNLEKVVQHGKRADSIVKNMLLHSREGSGEHRAADVNALVDESLNLAYHGARAENPAFNVTLERDFDPLAGQVEVFPQEITRVLINLISNGFYAVSKRNAELNASSNFEPQLKASTRRHGDRVEIRIRDNGIGIPPDVKAKIFNPFFTTKPAGVGTGLGLSMSHDIIVKQHGGSIDVVTEPGAFAEFIVTLPLDDVTRAGDR